MAKPSILFVDDNPDIRTVISIGLKHLGYQVVTVGDMPAAYTALEQQVFDLVILDNGLPGAEGVDSGAEIIQKSKNPKLPIVLFTGTRNADLEARAKTNGFTDCWIKPMGLMMISRKIESLLNELK